MSVKPVTTIFQQINGRPEEDFPEGFRYYDEGIKAAKDGRPFTVISSISWKDGYRDEKQN